MAATNLTSPPRRKIALIIGNNHYSRSEKPLRHCINDADDLSALLKRINFGVTTKHDLTNDGMITTLSSFSEKIQNGDLVLFYFSGHGYQFENKNYLIPIDDAKIEKEENVADYGTSVERTIDRFAKRNPSYVTIFILDCCREYWPKNIPKKKGNVEGTGLQEIVVTAGTYIQFACGTNKTASDGLETERNGLFTKHLLKHISEPNKDIQRIFRSITRGVYNESGGTQFPWGACSLLLDEDVYLHESIAVSSGQSLPFTHVNINKKWKQNDLTVAGGNGYGNQLNQLSRPEGICVDDDNQCIYIAEWANHRIVKWKYGAKNGQVVAGGNGEGNRIDQLNWPTDVIIDKVNDSIIICDPGNRRVVRWPRRNGTDGQTIIYDIDCYGLAMDNNGNLYVSDSEKNEVRRWKIGETKGAIVAGGNREGKHLNQLNGPTYIFVDEDYSVYVSDCWNHRVMKWMKGAKEGIVVAGGQGEGNSLIQLYCPRGVIADQIGHVYVADSINDRIMRWSPGSKEGSVVVDGNREGQQPNQLSNPTGLSFDRQGNLYVADNHSDRVQKFDIDSN